MLDGYEYQSAVDLNDDEFQHPNTALPFPGKRPYPNPLFPDADVDYDGDTLTLKEEHDLWVYTWNVTHTDPRALGDMSYSDGKQYSRSRIIPSGTHAGRHEPTLAASNYDKHQQFLDWVNANGYRTVMLDDNEPWWNHAAVRNPYGLFDMNRDGTETTVAAPGYWESELYYYDRYSDGYLSDDERDEDADGLTNFDETHGRMTLTYWAGCYTAEKPWHITYAQTSHVDRDTDGDGDHRRCRRLGLRRRPERDGAQPERRVRSRRHQRARVQGPEPAAAADGLLARDRLWTGQPVQPVPPEPPLADLPAPGERDARGAVGRLAELVLPQLAAASRGPRTRAPGRFRRRRAQRVASEQAMTDPADPGLRASDADREATAQRLHTAALEGRLDPEELDERLTAAYAAKHCSELARLTVDVTPAPARAPLPPAFVRPASALNGFAIASLVLSLVWFWWIGSVLAVIFGHLALNQIGGSGGTQRGKGLAIAGLAIGYLGLLGLVAVLFGLWI